MKSAFPTQTIGNPANQTRPASTTPLLTSWLAVARATTRREPIGYQALERHLRQGIVQGQLPAGLRLPTSRALATALALGRNVVKDAYAVLAREGLVLARGRHGTFVAETGAPAPRPDFKPLPQLRRRLPTTPQIRASARHDAFDWRLGRVHTACLPLSVWRSACREAGRHAPPVDHGDPRGDAGLRDALTTWLRTRRALSISPEQIVITAGAGQAIELLARALVRSGDTCAVEDPGYPRAATSFARYGARVVGLTVDDEGACVDDLAHARQKPALVHLTPAHQYPLGARLSPARRHALLEFARGHGALIIENEYDHEFVHDGQRFAPLAASAPEHVVLVGTFARAISPALRLGYLVAPRDIAAAVARLIEQEQAHASWPVQQSARWLLIHGELDRHLRRVGKHYGHVREQLERALRGLSPRIEVSGLAGGLHAVLTAGSMSPTRFQQFLRHLIASGARFDEIDQFCLRRPPPSAMLVGYASLNGPRIAASARLLRQAVDHACAR